MANPDSLYVIGDGSKPNNPIDAERVRQTRAIIEETAFNCEVFKNYAETNMGLRERIATGLSWFFSHVEHGIIMEDDILASPSFFPFCQELLERYRHEKRIFMISGHSPTPDPSVEYDYYISAFPGIWGWATWRDRWQDHFRLDIAEDASRPEKQVRFPGRFESLLEARYWAGLFHDQANKRLNSWAYSWTYAKTCGGGVGIVPTCQLIENIGLGHELATNTLEARKEWGGTSEPDEIVFPLRHPPSLEVDHKWDRRNFFVQRMRLPELKPQAYASLRYRLRVYADTLAYSTRARAEGGVRRLLHATPTLPHVPVPPIETKGVFAVMGIPYSGAAAMAYLLQKAGVNMGERMTFPDFEHPGGAVEDRAFADLHDAMWERSRLSRILPDPPVVNESDVHSIQAVLKDRDPSRFWGWHEWRTLPVLPLYERMVKPLYLIGVYHDPHVVISTMRRARRADPEVKRNAAVVAEAWLRYQRMLLRAVSERPETSILFSAGQLADHPESCLQAVASKFGVTLSMDDFDEVAYRAWLPQWSVRWDVTQRMIDRVYGRRLRGLVHALNGHVPLPM